MSAQELIALFRSSQHVCPSCRRIVARYERTLRLEDSDLAHLETCILRLS